MYSGPDALFILVADCPSRRKGSAAAGCTDGGSLAGTIELTRWLGQLTAATVARAHARGGLATLICLHYPATLRRVLTRRFDFAHTLRAWSVYVTLCNGCVREQTPKHKKKGSCSLFCNREAFLLQSIPTRAQWKGEKGRKKKESRASVKEGRVATPTLLK